MPHNITGVASTTCEKETLQYAKRVALIGDSIVGELQSVLANLLGQNLSFTLYSIGNLAGTRYNHDMSLSQIYGNTSFLTAHHLVSNASGIPTVQLWPSLFAETWDAVFVGGMGLHTLFRPVTWNRTEDRLSSPDGANRTLFSPYLHHLHIAREWSARFVCLSRALRTPFVFVGSMPVDIDVILLDPPKFDWDSFHEFALADLMVRAEKQVEQELRQHLSRSFANVSFFHPSKLAHECPGVRCDGMHYGSQNANYNCHSSLSLWCPLVSFFVRCNLPSLLRRSPMQSPNSGFNTSQRSSGLLSCAPHFTSSTWCSRVCEVW